MGDYWAFSTIAYSHEVLKSIVRMDTNANRLLRSESTGAGDATSLLPEQKIEKFFYLMLRADCITQDRSSEQSVTIHEGFITINFNMYACVLCGNAFPAPLRNLSASLTLSRLSCSERFLAGSRCHVAPQVRTASPFLPSGFSEDADALNAWGNPLCIQSYATQKCGQVKIPWGNSQPMEDLNQRIKMSSFCPPS